MTSKKILVETENLNYTKTEGDYQSAKSITGDDEFPQYTTNKKDDTRTETVTQCIDYTQSDHSNPLKKPAPKSIAHHPKVCNIQEALSCMTINDFDQFLNVYKVITSSDPNMDKNIRETSVEHFLSGKLLNKECFNEINVAELDVKSAPTNDEVQVDNAENDYTFFDVYDHIESWKQRIRPTMSKIEDITQKCKAIVQRTSKANVTLEVDKHRPKTALEQTFENYDVTTSSSRYLSNIDKYIEIDESRDLLSKTVHLQSQTVDNGINKNLNNTDNNNKRISNENRDTKEVQLPLIGVKSRHTLLVPSNAYLDSKFKSNESNLDVKTYFIE